MLSPTPELPGDLIETHENLLEKTHRDFLNLSATYPIPKPYLTYVGNNNTVIHRNLSQLLPRVKYEYHKGKFTADEITQWIKMTNRYVANMVELFITERNTELHNIGVWLHWQECSRNFDIVKVEKLPEDIVNYIYSFLPRETRVQLLLDKYPNFKDMLRKWTIPKLKRFYKHAILDPHLQHVLLENNLVLSRQDNLIFCLPRDFPMRVRKRFQKKTDIVDLIMEVVDIYRHIDPKTMEGKNYFNKQALKILQLILRGTYGSPGRPSLGEPTVPPKPPSLNGGKSVNLFVETSQG
jgi:hypothetical protein